MKIILLFFIIVSWLAPDKSYSQSGSGKIIQVSNNGRYFIDKYGKPFIWLGDTQWELFNLFTVSDASALLTRRKEQDFNIIQVMARGGFPDWSPQSTLRTMQGAQAWQDNNPLIPNENYFLRVDTIISIAEKLDILLVVGVFHARDIEKGWITEQNVKPWAKWLANRYKDAKNIIWSMYPHAEQASIPIVQATIQGLTEGDLNSHLITMHPDPSPKSSSFMHTEPWLSFNTLQTWSNSILNFDMVKTDYKKLPIKPVVNGEARYEREAGTKPVDIRHGAYWSFLAGGFYTYGHEGNWRYQHKWREWIDAPGALQMKVLKGIFESIEWWNLIPDQTVFEGNASDNTAAVSAKRDWIIVYLPGSDNIILKMDKIKASKMVTATWIDPSNGNRKPIGNFSTSGTRNFTSPKEWEDAVLLIQKL